MPRVMASQECLALPARSQVEDLVARFAGLALTHFAQQMTGLDAAWRGTGLAPLERGVSGSGVRQHAMTFGVVAGRRGAGED